VKITSHSNDLSKEESAFYSHFLSVQSLVLCVNPNYASLDSKKLKEYQEQHCSKLSCLTFHAKMKMLRSAHEYRCLISHRVK
jgi:hypothetical protein